MNAIVLVLYALLCLGCSHDITVGNIQGRKVFDEVREANPAIWRQYENVTVVAPENEIISAVVVTDMRPEKDGDVEIVDGGELKKSVTIQLRSPTVLRGYEFRIEVYSAPDTVATDAEEHLYNNANVTPMQSNVPTEIADSFNKDETQDGLSLQSNEATEPPVNAPNMDGNDGPTAVTGDINTDSIRPARETLTVTTESGVNEATTETSTTPLEADVSAVNGVTNTDAAITISYDQSTPMSVPLNYNENVPDNASPSDIFNYIQNRESIRPARRTEDNNNGENVDTSEISVQTEENIDATTQLPAEESSSINPGDDTVDLTPPKIDATYNTDFSDLETTANPVEASTLNDVPRAGRGVNFDDGFGSGEASTTLANTEPDNESSTPTKTEITTPSITEDGSQDEESTNTGSVEGDEETSTPTITEVTTPTLDEDHTTTLDDQLRNTRGTSNEHEDDNNINSPEDAPQNTPQNEENTPSGDIDVQQPKPNVIIINLNEVTPKDDNNKLTYAIPIVLLIGSENNYPTIKIVTENVSNERNENNQLYPIQPVNDYLEPSEYDYKGMESGGIEKGDYMPSGDVVSE